jgi:hypothetical protein
VRIIHRLEERLLVKHFRDRRVLSRPEIGANGTENKKLMSNVQ